MRISPVDAYSSYVYMRPLEYSVPNTSGTSDSYAESVRKNGGGNAVTPSKPVMYADSQSVASSGKENREKAKQVSRYYNRIASRHFGEATGYGSGGEAKGYEAEGRILDLFV